MTAIPRPFRHALLSAAALMLAGCVMPAEPERPLATQDELNYLRAEIRNQRQYVAALEQQIEQLNATTAQDRYNRDASSANYASGAQVAALQQQVAELQKQVRALDAARATDRAAIYDDITKKVASLVKTSAPAPSKTSKPISNTGFEHIVQPGESLSKIAAAYGVKMDIIAQANNISNPANIRIGQKLFIPDP